MSRPRSAPSSGPSCPEGPRTARQSRPSSARLGLLASQPPRAGVRPSSAREQTVRSLQLDFLQKHRADQAYAIPPRPPSSRPCSASPSVASTTHIPRSTRQGSESPRARVFSEAPTAEPAYETLSFKPSWAALDLASARTAASSPGGTTGRPSPDVVLGSSAPPPGVHSQGSLSSVQPPPQAADWTARARSAAAGTQQHDAQAAEAPRRPLSAQVPQRRPMSASASRQRPQSATAAVHTPGPASVEANVASSLLSVLRHVYEHYENRPASDIWARLAAPLQSLVPCEYVCFVVLRTAQVPPEPEWDEVVNGAGDIVRFVNHWPADHIESFAASKRRMVTIPSQEATGKGWEAAERLPGSDLRCLAAVPFFDDNGEVVAVAKLRNRLVWHEFARTDLHALSAFSALLAALTPGPKGWPCEAPERAPRAHLVLTDRTMSAMVRWELCTEKQLAHEILCTRLGSQQAHALGTVMPCGVLPATPTCAAPVQFGYEFPVPGLEADNSYAFCVRTSTLQDRSDWSQSSASLSTALAPPCRQSGSGMRVQCVPGDDLQLARTAVQISWAPFKTCNPGLRLVEYRVVARVTAQPSLSDRGGRDQDHPIVQGDVPEDGEETASEGPSAEQAGLEQTVALFISDGSMKEESVQVRNLRSDLSYTFAVEARYPYLGTRAFKRVLLTSRWSFPVTTSDLLLQQPRALSADELERAGLQDDGGLALWWPYPEHRLSGLGLQMRYVCDGAGGRRLRSTLGVEVSQWITVPSADYEEVQAPRNVDAAAPFMLCLRPSVLQGCSALQFRAISLPYGAEVSAESAWFQTSRSSQAPPELWVGTELEVLPGASFEADGVDHFKPGDVGRITMSPYEDSEGVGRFNVHWERTDIEDAVAVEGWTRQFKVIAQAAFESGGSVAFELRPTSDSDNLGLAVKVAWPGAIDAIASRRSIEDELLRGRSSGPLRYQIRLRSRPNPGEDCRWEELEPRLLPSALSRVDQAAACCYYEHDLDSRHWSSRTGEALQVEVRHEGPRAWSSWTPVGETVIDLVPIEAPRGTLTTEQARLNEIVLSWPSFTSAEPALSMVKYRVLCRERQMGDDTPFENFDWRVVGSFSAPARAASDRAEAVERYSVTSLVPERSYFFAVEGRYAQVPSSEMVERAMGQMEVEKPVSFEKVQFPVTPGKMAVEDLVLLRGCAGSAEQRLGARLRWSFGVAPAGLAVPATLCYQLRCLSEAGELTLPPAVLVKRAEGADPGDSQKNGIGEATFWVDKDAKGDVIAGTTDLAEAQADLAMDAVSLLGAGPPVRFAVRVGCPCSGSWGAWSEGVSPEAATSCPPPSPVPGDVVAVEEELWDETELESVVQKPHKVMQVLLSWCPFQAARGMPLDLHERLGVHYEVAVWAVDGDSEVGVDEARAVLCARLLGDQVPAKLVFRQLLASGPCSLVIPGSCFHASRPHFVRVVARYTFASGAAVPETPAAPEAGVLVSLTSFCPTGLGLPRPCVEPFAAPFEQAAEAQDQRCAVISVFGLAGRKIGGGDDCVGVEVLEGRPFGATGPGDQEEPGWVSWNALQVHQEADGRQRLLLSHLAPRVCQFRLRQGTVVSEPSGWCDTEVWAPETLRGSHLSEQITSFCGSRRMGAPAHLDGLCVALGIGPDGSFCALLAWPRCPPEPGAQQLQRYQLRHRVAPDGEWKRLAPNELPGEHGSVGVVEHQVRNLPVGGKYEFSLRLCNANHRWSSWTPATPPLTLDLPPPAPRRAADQGGVRVTALTCSKAKLAWEPFCVPARTASEPPPLLLGFDGEAAEVLGADYEVVVQSEDSKTHAVLQHQGAALLEEALAEAAVASELELEVEPQQAVCFQVRARLRAPGSRWGPGLRSATLPQRLLPISTATPLVDLYLAGVKSGGARSSAAAALRFRCAVQGFGPAAGSQRSDRSDRLEVDRKAAALATYQVRQRPATMAASGGDEGWTEVPLTGGDLVLDSLQHAACFEIPIHSAVVLPPGERRGVFSARFSDEFGRWTAWSKPSEPVLLRAPSLVPPRTESPGVNLVVSRTPAGGALLEWSAFRSTTEDIGAGIGLDGLADALQRVVYQLQVLRRRGGSSADWEAIPLGELESERGHTGVHEREVPELDDRFEHKFRVNARWADVPLVLGAQEWSAPISSATVPAHERGGMRPPHAPQAEAAASDSGQFCMEVRWHSLRRHSAVTAKASLHYQVRYAKVNGEGKSAGKQRPQWTLDAPFIEQEQPSQLQAQQVVRRLSDLQAGCEYRLGVRVGDGREWSEWSPTSEPVLLAVQPPVPHTGDCLTVDWHREGVGRSRLQWRHFRSDAGLRRLEYKVFAVAEDTFAQAGREDPLVFEAGCVTEPSLEAEQVSWVGSTGIPPGVPCRFYVCARYVSLPLEALAPPQSAQGAPFVIPPYLAGLWSEREPVELPGHWADEPEELQSSLPAPPQPISADHPGGTSPSSRQSPPSAARRESPSTREDSQNHSSPRGESQHHSATSESYVQELPQSPQQSFVQDVGGNWMVLENAAPAAPPPAGPTPSTPPIRAGMKQPAKAPPARQRPESARRRPPGASAAPPAARPVQPASSSRPLHAAAPPPATPPQAPQSAHRVVPAVAMVPPPAAPAPAEPVAEPTAVEAPPAAEAASAKDEGAAQLLAPVWQPCPSGSVSVQQVEEDESVYIRLSADVATGKLEAGIGVSQVAAAEAPARPAAADEATDGSAEVAEAVTQSFQPQEPEAKGHGLAVPGSEDELDDLLTSSVSDV